METPSLSLKDTGRIYLDHNATTPPLVSVLESLPVWASQWGNPSSIHWSGRGPKLLLREARNAVAQMLGCHPLEVVFTSGGSESNNLIIKGYFESQNLNERNEYITTEVEHPSVAQSFEYLKSRGAIVHKLKVSRAGQIDLAQYKSWLSSRTALVSIMAANNEIGSLFPIREMAELAHAVGAKFHTDAVQLLGKLPLNVTELGVDFASFASHKIYALKGCGVAYAKKGHKLKSLISGGAQERGRRAGTENILAIAAMGHVAQILPGLIVEKSTAMAALRDLMETEIKKNISGVLVTGAEVARLPNTSSLVIDKIDGESLLMNLDIEGVSVSTGAACSSGSPEPSPVLLAIGLSRKEAQKSLRVSLGWSSTKDDVLSFVQILKNVVERLREFNTASSKTQIVEGEEHV